MTLRDHVNAYLFSFRSVSPRRTRRGSENETLDAAFQQSDIEVDQQPGLQAGQLHVGQQLRLVDTLDLIDALQLDDQHVLHEDVDTVAAVEPNALVLNWLWMLKPELDAVQLQLVRQALLVGRLE